MPCIRTLHEQQRITNSPHCNRTLRQWQQPIFGAYRRYNTNAEPVEWSLAQLDHIVRPLTANTSARLTEAVATPQLPNHYRSPVLAQQVAQIVDNSKNEQHQHIVRTIAEQNAKTQYHQQQLRDRVERSRRNAGRYREQWRAITRTVILRIRAVRSWTAASPSVLLATSLWTSAKRKGSHPKSAWLLQTDNDDVVVGVRPSTSDDDDDDIVRHELKIAAPTVRYSDQHWLNNDEQAPQFIRFNADYFRCPRTVHWPHYASEAIEKLPHMRDAADIGRIRQVLSSLDVFRRYSAQQQLNICRVVRLECYTAGRVVIRQGHRALGFYMVYGGTLDVCQKVAVGDDDKAATTTTTNAFDGGPSSSSSTTYRYMLDGSRHKVLSTLTTGANFGEIAIILGMTRGASIIARDNCMLLAVTKDDLITYNLYDRLREDYDKRAEFLRHPLLQDWSAERLNTICFGANTERYAFGETIVSNSDREPFVIFVVDGRCLEVITMDVTRHRLYKKLLKFRQIMYELFNRAVRLRNPQLLPHRFRKQLPRLEDKRRLFIAKYIQKKQAETLAADKKTVQHGDINKEKSCKPYQYDDMREHNGIKHEPQSVGGSKTEFTSKTENLDAVFDEIEQPQQVAGNSECYAAAAKCGIDKMPERSGGGQHKHVEQKSSRVKQQQKSSQTKFNTMVARKQSLVGTTKYTRRASANLDAFKPKPSITALPKVTFQEDNSTTRRQQQPIGVNMVLRALKAGDIFGLYKTIGVKEQTRMLLSEGCTVIRLSVSKFQSAVDVPTLIRAFDYVSPLPPHSALMRQFYQDEATSCHQKSLFNSYLIEVSLARDAVDNSRGVCRHATARFPTSADIYRTCRQGNEFVLHSVEAAANDAVKNRSRSRSHYLSVEADPLLQTTTSSNQNNNTNNAAARAVPRVHYMPTPSNKNNNSTGQQQNQSSLSSQLAELSAFTLQNVRIQLPFTTATTILSRAGTAWMPFNKQKNPTTPDDDDGNIIISTVPSFERMMPTIPSRATLLDVSEADLPPIEPVTSSTAVLAFCRRFAES